MNCCRAQVTLICLTAIAINSCSYTPPSRSVEKIDSLLIKVNHIDSLVENIPIDTLKKIYLNISLNIDTMNLLIGNRPLDTASLRVYGAYATIGKSLKRGLPDYSKYYNQIKYSKKQLVALKNDVLNHRVKPDSLIWKYIADEENVMNTNFSLYHAGVTDMVNYIPAYHLLEKEITNLKKQWRNQTKKAK